MWVCFAETEQTQSATETAMITISLSTNIKSAILLLDRIETPNVFRINEEVADELLRRLTTYPGQSRKPQPFVSDKQRRWFFAALQSGAITVPYRRTNTLARGWSKVRTTAGYTVINKVPYASLVQGETRDQARYHQKWWESSTEVTRDVDKTIPAQLDRSVQKTLDAMFGGTIPETPIV